VPLSAPGHYVVGAQMPKAGPSLPRAGPSGARPPWGANASWGRPLSPDLLRPRPAFRAPQAPAGGQYGPPPPRAPLPPQETLLRDNTRFDADPPGFQHRRNKGKGKGKNKFVPFTPYSTDPRSRRPSSPVAKWRAAISDPVDDAMNGFRAVLDEYPAALTKPAWSDLLLFLNKAKKQGGDSFDRKAFIPELKVEFDSLLEKVQAAATAQQDEEQQREIALAEASNALTEMLEELKALDHDIAEPLPGADIPALESQRRILGARIAEQEKLVDKMDGAEEPADTEPQGAPSVAAPDAPPVALRPSHAELWPETNYQDHADRTAPLFPVVTGKAPLASLKPVMRDQVDSKLYLPRSLELYSCDELAKLAPKRGARWNNRYEDPLEPVKSWSWAEFETVYDKPGYHFMFARVAQLGPMFKDPKLTLLRSKLAQRWQCEVHFERMSPRQDWMLCTVPSGSKGESEAQAFDLIRLAETNAVYVIRRFAPMSRARDLEWVVKGSVADENSIFLQMRKRLLEFETGDVRLGWRVLGVRKGGATSKFRGTFTLESEDVYWPWSLEFGHKHGSVPDTSPLLNFEPSWSARRPYACQGCYSSDHFTAECPLPFMKLGGLSIISMPARSLVLSKKAGERVLDLEKATWQLPIRVPPSPSVKSAAAPRHARLPGQPAAPPALSVVEEEGLDVDVDMEESGDESVLEQEEPSRITALSNFLCGRLLGNADPVVGLNRKLIHSVCKFFGGSIHPVLFSLRRDGHLPVDVSNEVLFDEFTRPPSEFSASPPGSKPLPHYCHAALTGAGLDPIGTEPPFVQGAVRLGSPVAPVPTECMSLALPWRCRSNLVLALPVPGDAQYVTPAVLGAFVRSQSHVSATPTPNPAPASAPSAVLVSLEAPAEALTPAPAPAGSHADGSLVPLDNPVVSGSPGMAKYYAPAPQPIQPSQSSTFTWPDSLLDVAPAPASPAAPVPQQPAEAPVEPTEPLFFDPSPPAVFAPIPRDSMANRALSSMAMGRTIAEDLMDIEAGVPLPSLEAPILRNPLVGNGDEIDDILFAHIRPLQGDALIRAAGVLPSELLPARMAVPARPAPALEPDVPLTTSDSIPLTQELSYTVRSPVDTYSDPSLSQSLVHLAKLFPSVSSETFTLVLNKTNGDLSAASAWMQSVADVTKAKNVLTEAFPDAPSRDVESAVRLCKGDFLLSFYWLAKDHEHTAEWSDFKQVRGKGVMDVESLAPDFLYDDPATEAYEWQWWQIAVSIRRHRVADYPDVVPMWNALASVSTATREITPRFMDYVCKLGAMNTDGDGFKKAVKTLRSQPDFQAIEAVAGPAIPCGRDDPRDAASTILQVLLSDGYISPPAAAWLAIRVSGSMTMYFAMTPLFLAFPVVRRKLWNDRNLHLSAWADTNMKARGGTNSPTGSRISAADAKSAYSTVIPAAKGKDLHPIFSKESRRSNPKVVKRAPTRAQTKAAQDKKKKAEVAAARLAKKGADIEAQIGAELALMEDEKESEE